MTAPVSPSQPKGVEYLRWLASPDAERMSEYWRINEFVRSGLEAADRIEELEARAEQAERSVDVLESNARVQAKLLADTGRRVEELEAVLTEILAIDGHGYAVAPMGFALRTRATAALPQSRGVARTANDPL